MFRDERLQTADGSYSTYYEPRCSLRGSGKICPPRGIGSRLENQCVGKEKKTRPKRGNDSWQEKGASSIGPAEVVATCIGSYPIRKVSFFLVNTNLLMVKKHVRGFVRLGR